jgi:hypothetical protein
VGFGGQQEDGCSIAQKRPEIHGVFHHVEYCRHTCDVSHAIVVDCDGIDKGVWNQLLQSAFATQLAFFRSHVQYFVAKAIRPLHEEASSCRVCLEHNELDVAPHVDFVDEEKVDMYGCFSPCARLCLSSLPTASMSEATEVVDPLS